MATKNSSGIRTTITSFTIQDVDGLIYKFAKHSLTKVLESSYCDANITYQQTQPNFKNGEVYHQAGFDNVIINPWIIGSWYLSEIEDALTHRKVFLNYTLRNINARAGEDISFNDGDKDYCIITHKKSITQTPDITSIVYPDGHNITFTYAANTRADLSGGYALSAVDISYLGRSLSKYKLNTTYFLLNRYGTPISDYQKKLARLCLRSVQKIGVDLKEDTPPYLFDYYTGSNTADDFVPPAFFYAKDIWGFYNGSNSVGWNNEAIQLNNSISQLSFSQLKGLCFLRATGGQNFYNAKSGYAKNGLLKQIIYPTGGTLTYQYNQNSGVIGGAVQLTSGVHVGSTSSTDGGFSNNCNNPVSTSYNYVLNNGASSLWGLEIPLNSVIINNHYQPEEKYYHWTWSSLPLGECTWNYQYPGILSQQQAIDLPSWVNLINTLAPVLGILNVISTIKDIVAFINGSPVGLIITLILDIAQVFITCIGNNAKDKTVGVYYNFDLNSGNPLPTQFKRVEIIENPGTIGKTVQEFTSDDDYTVWEPTNSALSQKQRFAPWAYGLPKLISVYDANGIKVKETQNVYNFNTSFFSKGCFPGERFYRNILLKKPLSKLSVKCLVNLSSG